MHRAVCGVSATSPWAWSRAWHGALPALSVPSSRLTHAAARSPSGPCLQRRTPCAKRCLLGSNDATLRGLWRESTACCRSCPIGDRVLTRPPTSLCFGQAQREGHAVPTVDVHQARARLSRLLDLAEGGQEVVIARRSQPVGRHVACRARGKRRFGRMKVCIVDDGILDLLPEAELARWEGSGRGCSTTMPNTNEGKP